MDAADKRRGIEQWRAREKAKKGELKGSPESPSE